MALYATVADMEKRYPARDLIQLTNEVTPLICTFSGVPGTVVLPFGNLTPLVFVQSQPTQLPSPPNTYVVGVDYTVDSLNGVITRIASGAIPLGATVYVSVDNANYMQIYLIDASDEIDSYLESRFDLPLPNPPDVLTRLCCEVAMFHLQNLRPIHDLEWAKVVYENAIRFLTKVSEGKLTLGLHGADETEPASASPPQIVFVDAGGDSSGVLPNRVFSRGTMKCY